MNSHVLRVSDPPFRMASRELRTIDACYFGNCVQQHRRCGPRSAAAAHEDRELDPLVAHRRCPHLERAELAQLRAFLRKGRRPLLDTWRRRYVRIERRGISAA